MAAVIRSDGDWTPVSSEFDSPLPSWTMRDACDTASAKIKAMHPAARAQKAARENAVTMARSAAEAAEASAMLAATANGEALETLKRLVAEREGVAPRRRIRRRSSLKDTLRNAVELNPLGHGTAATAAASSSPFFAGGAPAADPDADAALAAEQE